MISLTAASRFFKNLLALVILLCFSAYCEAQSGLNIRGYVAGSDDKPLNNAYVLLVHTGFKDTVKTVTDEKGSYLFKNITAGNISLIVSYIGYSKLTRQYDYSNADGEKQIPLITLVQGDNLLETVTLESNKVQIKEDTISYLIDSTMYRKNDNVEEVLKKLPGVQVDKDGTVTAQGKQVTKVKVNGKEFFNGDVTTATRELNADMVDRIQIIDDYGDQSAFTGVKDGDPSKTMNILLKKDKNKGYFGNATVGGGTEERYLGSVSVNKFNNSQQISILGNMNNTNASTFNFGSVGGGAMGSMVSGMVRSMGIGKGGGGIGALMGNFGNSNGITSTKSAGINYRDEWGRKISAYGSYSFSNKGTQTSTKTTQQNIFQNTTNTNIQNTEDYTTNENHRFSFNLEYRIDSSNYLKFTPAVTYNSGNTENFNEFSFLNNTRKTNEGTTQQNSNSNTPNLNANLLYNHKFKKRGRTLSANLSSGTSRSEGDNDFENLSTLFFPNGSTLDSNLYQRIIQDNSNRNFGFKTSYIEPINKKRSLEFNYAYNYQFTGNDKETFAIDPLTVKQTFVDSLSNIFDNIYITNKFGVNFRTTQKKFNYTIGLAVQPASIESNSITGRYAFKQTIVNYFPVIRYAYNFSRSRSFNVNYNGTTNQPSYSQLQPVYDYSNPQYITLGNPNLRPEFTNTLSMRYNNFDLISGNVFFGNISFSFTNDKIVNNIINRGFGVQETQYLNSDGFFTAFGFYNYSKPIKNRKYVFNIGGNVTYNNNVSFINNERNKGTNWLVGQRFTTDFKIKKWLESSAGVNYSLNSSKYSLQPQANADATTWTITHSSRFFFPHNWKFSYDLDKALNRGLASNVNANPLIINATLEKSFLKKQNAALKLQAFDMLNENTSVNRSVTATAITDTRSNRLGRYFMLSLVFRLNKFSGTGQASGGNMMMMGPPGMQK